MRALILAFAFALTLGCNEDSEEGTEACMRASVGDACSFTEPCVVEVIDHVDGRCGSVAHVCEGGRVVEREDAEPCASDLGVADDG